MKYLAYLLIVANVVYFLWETGVHGGRNGTEAYREMPMPSGVERIALGLEVAESVAEAAEPPPTAVPEPGPAQPAEPAPVPPPEPAPRKKGPECFVIGPVQAKAEAESWLELIKSHAPKAAVESKLGDVPDKWWVLFPRAVSLEAGRENRRMLAGKGIVDAWLFDKGPLQGAISLGLYDSRQRAETARDAFLAKNIVTEVAPRMVRGQVHWLRVPWPRPQLELEEIIKTLNTQDVSLRIPAPLPCEG